MEKIIESKTKNRLLAFFATKPERNFFLREIRKKVNGSKLNNNLSALAKQGILSSYSKRGKKYFRLNKKNRIYSDLRDWSKRLKRKTEDDLLKVLKKLSGLRVAIGTGLFTGYKGECDILLVGKFSKAQLARFEKTVQKLVGQEINYAVMSVEEFKYRKDTFDRFMKDILENEHIMLMDKTK